MREKETPHPLLGVARAALVAAVIAGAQAFVDFLACGAHGELLWIAARGVMQVAAEEGRIITRRPAGVPAADLDEIEGRFVYKRERCGRCGSSLEVLEIADRAINACRVCQPR